MHTTTLDTTLATSTARPRAWLGTLLATDASTPALIMRVTLALVMLPHGAQKLLGWFGGFGLAGTLGFMTEVVGLPWLIALLVILLESIGALALLAGLATRPIAAGIAAIMVGAIVTTHAQHGFFMNWFGNQAGEGFEYHVLVLGLALALMVGGGGRAAIDARLAEAARR